MFFAIYKSVYADQEIIFVVHSLQMLFGFDGSWRTKSLTRIDGFHFLPGSPVAQHCSTDRIYPKKGWDYTFPGLIKYSQWWICQIMWEHHFPVRFIIHQWKTFCSYCFPHSVLKVYCSLVFRFIADTSFRIIIAQQLKCLNNVCTLFHRIRSLNRSKVVRSFNEQHTR